MTDTTATRAARAAALAVLLLGLLPATAHAQGFGGGDPFTFTPEKASVTLAPGASGELVVVIGVPPEHHLYKATEGGPPFRVEVSASAGLRVGTVKLPEAHEEISFGEPAQVFADGSRIVIPITIADDASGEQTLTAEMFYQGCSADSCYMPTSKKATFTVAVKTSEGGVANGGGESPALPRPAPAPTREPKDPFRFTAASEKVTLAPGATGEVAFTTTVPEGHHLYDTGPAGTLTVSVEAPADVNVGAVKRPPTAKEKDPLDGHEIDVFADGARFAIPIGVKPDAATGDRTVVAKVKYQGCSETGCFPPATREVRFTVSVAGEKVAGGTGVPTAATGGDATPRSPTGNGTGDEATVSDADAAIATNKWAKKLKDIEDDYGLFPVYLICFVFGLGLCLTPCVFPMISLTASVFGDRAATAAGGAPTSGSPLPTALLYGFGIGVTFGAFGLVAGLLGKSVNLGLAFQNPYILSGIIAIFVALSLSMFGFYDLKPPSWVTERYQSASEKGTYASFFLMGVLGALVAAPCAGPPVIGLSIFVAPKGPLTAASLLFICGLGLAAPFMILGVASGAGKAMPRPGPWLEKVKKFFGILLLGTAIYFGESLIGPTYYPFVLGVFALTVGVCAGALDRLESGAGGFARAQQTFAVFSLIMGIYLFGGFLLREGFVHPPVSVPASGKTLKIEWQKDLDASLAPAKADGKPVFVDFTATWCQYCKQIESGALRDPRVIEELQRFVSVKVDVTTSGDGDPAWKTVQKVGTKAPPWLAFFDSSGELIPSYELGYEGGVIDAPALLDALRKVK